MRIKVALQKTLISEFVEFIPANLSDGVLYISEKYKVASHLCCCGCRKEVVTPLNPAKWQLTNSNGEISLYPSIGNWSFSCKSHYWIKHGKVQWAYAMSDDEIHSVRLQDTLAVEKFAKQNNKNSFGKTLKEWFIKKLIPRK